MNGSTVTSYFAYEYWDTAKEMAVTTQGWNAALKGNNAYWRPGYAYHTYDVNGHLAQAIDAGADGAVGNADDRTFRYINDAQGLTLLRDEIAGTHVNRIERYYYANGVRVGDVGNDGPSRTDYTQAIVGRKVDHKSYKSWSPVASADFDQNYEPVSPTYPGPTPSSYTVRSGDTLQSIARSVWGDASLWYLIADANGLSGNEILKAGATLTLPNKITNLHNNAGTFRPYNPGEVIGVTSPTLPAAPPPPRRKKCGGLAIIVVAVVAVVATIATAGVMAGQAAITAAGGVMQAGAVAIGGALTATGIGFTGLAVAGAAGSIAGQLAGMALGVQDKFNWGGVAAGALTSMATAGLGNIGDGGVAGALGVKNATARLMVNSAVGNVASQGIGLLTGQQKSFSWTSVAASAISAPIANQVSKSLFGSNVAADGFTRTGGALNIQNPVANLLAQTTVDSLVSTTARLVIQGGRLDWAAVAADALSSFAQRWWSSDGVQAPSAEIPNYSEIDLDGAEERLKKHLLLNDPVKVTAKDDAGWSAYVEAANKAESMAKSAVDYMRLLKAGAVEKATNYLSELAENNPSLAHGVKVLGESLPELYDGLKSALVDAAPDILLDAAMAIGGAVVSPISGGASLAVSVATAMRRIDKLARFADGAGKAIGLLEKAYGDLPELLEKLEVSAGAELREKFNEILPGVEDTGVQSALGSIVAKANHYVVAFTDGIAKGSKLMVAIGHTMMRHGEVAERITGTVLEHSGLFDVSKVPGTDYQAIGPIQNRSNHGIDFIGRALTGRYAGEFVGFEIKAGLFKAAPALEGDQRRGAKYFIPNRLDRAISGEGAWSRGNAGTSEFASYIRQDMGRKGYVGFVISNDFIGVKGKENVRFREWK